jgi:NAD(P)-dependent dehydrogenase (short-subunit alcohol dehydrogenase family)
MKPVILVTGGSRGIGRAIAIHAARGGYDVAFTFIEDEKAAGEVIAAIEKLGRNCYAQKSNSSGGAAEIDMLLDSVERALGPITHLTNNVGITGRIGKLIDLPEDVLRKTVDVNAVGTILTCQRMVVRWTAPRVPGSIVNVSSIAATIRAPGEYVHYAATKAAVDAFSIGLSKELGPDGIRVNVVSPGTTNTEIHARGGDPGRPERVAPRVPLGRVGEPDEIAAAVIWLHSPEASYMTGAILRVGGGL